LSFSASKLDGVFMGEDEAKVWDFIWALRRLMASMESLIWSSCWPSRGMGSVAEGAILREVDVSEARGIVV